MIVVLYSRGRRDGPATRRRRPPGRAARPPDPDPATRRPRDVLRDHRPVARVPRPEPRDAGSAVGAAVATAVGAIDDFHGLVWWEKLAGQVLAASIPPIFGIWVDHFTFPFLGVYDLPAWVGVPLTVLWIVAVMNMVNFLDGLDGLAAGSAGSPGSPSL